jgi:hypothetical protein
MKSWLAKYVVRPARRVEINPYFALAAVKTETVLAGDLGRIMMLIYLKSRVAYPGLFHSCQTGNYESVIISLTLHTVLICFNYLFLLCPLTPNRQIPILEKDEVETMRKKTQRHSFWPKGFQGVKSSSSSARNIRYCNRTLAKSI